MKENIPQDLKDDYAAAEAWGNSVSRMPDDLKEQYQNVMRSHPSAGWKWTLRLFERIAAITGACDRLQGQYDTELAANRGCQRELAEARATNQELNRRCQALEKAVATQSEKGRWHSYFEAALSLCAREQEKVAEAQGKIAALLDALYRNGDTMIARPTPQATKEEK